jgi:K+ transporter
MTDELSFEAYLSLSQKKFEIYLLDKKSLKNIYKEEIYLENNSELIDHTLLHNFLDKNIFKIEKLIGKFLKNIFVIIENTKVLNSSLGIKKKNYTTSINKQFLETSLTELKDIFKENNQSYKIMHFIINKYSIDGVNYNLFENEIDGENMCVEVKFISIPNILMKEISHVLEKYQIKVDRFFDRNYINNFSALDSLDLSIVASNLKNGQNHNEIGLVPKNHKIKGFFEKFFQLFS